MLRRLSRAWRIVRELDLDAIREQAETPLQTLVVSEDEADGAALVSVLVGAGGGRRQPALWLATPGEAPDVLSRESIKLAVLVSRTAHFPAALDAVRDRLVARDAAVAVVLVGSFGYLDTFARHGEQVRIEIPVLTADQSETIARKLFGVVAPDRRLALGRQFPGLRQPLFDEIIEETSRANASYAFSTGLAEIIPLLDVPLNVGDLIVLTKNQLIMAYRLALAAGKQGRPRDVLGELVGVIGGGLLFRQIARELVGLVPVVGIVPKVAVAYGGTWAIGRAVVAWATGAEEATKKSLQHLYSAGLDRGRQVARQLTSRSAA